MSFSIRQSYYSSQQR